MIMLGKSSVFRVFVIMLSSDFWLWTSADVYSATSKMEYLIETRQKVIDDLHVYIDKEESRLADIKLYLKRYETEHERAKRDRPNYVGNPINAFTLIKRLTTDLYEIDDRINNTAVFPSRSLENSLKENSMVLYPKTKDMQGAALAIARLQKIYKLTVDDLANGVINGAVKSNKNHSVTIGHPMTWSDCHKLGIIIYNQKDYKNALAWQMKALKKLKFENSKYSRDAEIAVMDYIAIANYYLGDLEATVEWIIKILILDPSNQHARQNIVNTEGRIQEVNLEIENVLKSNTKINDNKIGGNAQGSNYTEGDDNSKDKETTVYTGNYNENDLEESEHYVSKKKTDLMYEALCRGEYDLASEVSSRLTCSYLNNKPFLRLAPFKMEQMYIDPDVYLFHDVVSDMEILQLQGMARPDFECATIADADDPEPDSERVNEVRISQVSWLPENKSEIIKKLSRRISDFTGLSVEAFENLQVSNYGVGGQYKLHYDCYPQSIPNVEKTNRIATALFYLSDVTRGGSTVFPRMGLSVPPARGSALFWMNLHRSGEMDQDTLHASCPVLEGSKWIANKWIRLMGHELIRPCTLDYQREHQFRELPASAPVLIH